MKTESIKSNEIVRDWYVVDAKDKTLGRLASSIAQILRGKNKVNFSPNLDMSDFIIVINAEKVILTGNKKNTKEYWRHTGYPGGIKETTPERLHESKPGEVLKLAVKRMLPSGPLAKKQLTKLKIYKGSEHPHEVQKPEIIDIKNINKKNIIKN